MDKDWSNYCTMSIVHFMAYPSAMSGTGPIAESISKIAEDPFFGAIEITSIEDSEEREAVRNVIDVSSIKVGFGSQPLILRGGLNLNSLDEREREAAVEALKAHIDEAAELGAKRFAFLSGKDPGDSDRSAALEALIHSTKELCAYGMAKGMAITCETFDRLIDKKALIGPSELACEYAAAVRSEYPNFGLMYDLSHQPLLFEDSRKALRLLAPYLVHIHVGNCVLDQNTAGYGDSHPRFGWPGGCNGVDELAQFITGLFDSGYLGHQRDDQPWVAFEVKPQSEKESSAQIVAGSKRIWQEAWRRATREQSSDPVSMAQL
jgi:sugar phosphate isomerase/epimerase